MRDDGPQANKSQSERPEIESSDSQCRSQMFLNCVEGYAFILLLISKTDSLSSCSVPGAALDVERRKPSNLLLFTELTF